MSALRSLAKDTLDCPYMSRLERDLVLMEVAHLTESEWSEFLVMLNEESPDLSQILGSGPQCVADGDEPPSPIVVPSWAMSLIFTLACVSIALAFIWGMKG